jgi:hypothetical protein
MKVIRSCLNTTYNIVYYYEMTDEWHETTSPLCDHITYLLRYPPLLQLIMFVQLLRSK